MVRKPSTPSAAGGKGGNGDDRNLDELREELSRLIVALTQIQANVDTDQNAAIIELRGDMEKLIGLVTQSNVERELAVAGLGNLDNVLIAGFSTLKDQLQPLRELAPRRQPLTEGQAARLVYLQNSQRRQEWASAGSLGVKEERVRFIGEDVVPLGPGSGPAGSHGGPSYAFTAAD